MTLFRIAFLSARAGQVAREIEEGFGLLAKAVCGNLGIEGSSGPFGRSAMPIAPGPARPLRGDFLFVSGAVARPSARPMDFRFKSKLLHAGFHGELSCARACFDWGAFPAHQGRGEVCTCCSTTTACSAGVLRISPRGR